MKYKDDVDYPVSELFSNFNAELLPDYPEYGKIKPLNEEDFLKKSEKLRLLEELLGIRFTSGGTPYG